MMARINIIIMKLTCLYISTLIIAGIIKILQGYFINFLRKNGEYSLRNAY